MISLPVVEQLKVQGYALYPGVDGSGIDINFSGGVTVLAGINGVGKTTLLNLIMRMLLGPSSPKATADIGRVSSRDLVLPKKVRYFADRVPNLPDHATATIKFNLGSTPVSLTRYLSTLKVKSAKINGRRIKVDDEILFVERLAKLAGLNSGYDYHIVVRYLQFFTEERLPILWSANTQFEFFKILFLDPELASEMNTTFASIQRVDTDYRNRVHQLGQKKKRLPDAKDSGNIELHTLKRLVSEAESEFRNKEENYVEWRDRFDEAQRRSVSLDDRYAECQAKLSEEERQFTYDDALYIQQALPTMDEKLKFLMQGLTSQVGCFVCGSKGKREHHTIGRKLRKGRCFVCDGSIPKRKEELASITPISSVKLNSIEEVIETIRSEMAEIEKERDNCEKSQEECERNLRNASSQRRDALYALEKLRSRLPDDDGGEINPLHDEIQREELALKELHAERKQLAETYRNLVAKAQNSLSSAGETIREKVSAYASYFLQEKVEVAFRRQSPMVLATGVAKVNVPTFHVKMASSTHPLPVERVSPDNVSESQKEFLDLGFRMALLDIVTESSPVMMIIETPEASLDSWFMRRAADLMRQFAPDEEGATRKLVATSNLNGTVMIPALLGLEGKDGKNKTIARDDPHLVNLMELTAKARVLEKTEARKMLESELGSYLHD